jgi:hypothetical protein
MFNPNYIFFLLISFSLIACQTQNKTKEEKAPQPPLREVAANLNETNPFNRKPPKLDPSLNITADEMDKLILCSLIVQESIPKQQKNIDIVAKRLNLTAKNKINKVIDKVGTEIFEKCTDSIDMKIVNKYIKDFTFFYNFTWEKIFDDYNKINFDKYKEENDLVYTGKQNNLMRRYGRVNELYKQKVYEERQYMDNENKKIKIANFEINSLPLSFKIGFFLVILLLFFGTIFYFLRTLRKKPLEKKKKEKKEKKKKTQ